MNDRDGEPPAQSRRRERSARYPGSTFLEALQLAREMSQKGVDGLPAESVAAAMGYKNIKTQTFSAPLSAARQFGLIVLREGGYSLTDLAREILHPFDPERIPALYRQAFTQPPLYSELCEKFDDRKVPDAPALANWLYHNHQITAAAKDSAAQLFLESAREVGVLGGDGVLRTSGVQDPAARLAPLPGGPTAAPTPSSPARASGQAPRAAARPRDHGTEAPTLAAGPAPSPAAPTAAGVSFLLKLWGPDEGKVVQVNSPEAMTQASLDRLIQTLRLMVKIEPD